MIDKEHDLIKQLQRIRENFIAGDPIGTPIRTFADALLYLILKASENDNRKR